MADRELSEALVKASAENAVLRARVAELETALADVDSTPLRRAIGQRDEARAQLATLRAEVLEEAADLMEEGAERARDLGQFDAEAAYLTAAAAIRQRALSAAPAPEAPSVYCRHCRSCLEKGCLQCLDCPCPAAPQEQTAPECRHGIEASELAEVDGGLWCHLCHVTFAAPTESKEPKE